MKKNWLYKVFWLLVFLAFPFQSNAAPLNPLNICGQLPRCEIINMNPMHTVIIDDSTISPRSISVNKGSLTTIELVNRSSLPVKIMIPLLDIQTTVDKNAANVIKIDLTSPPAKDIFFRVEQGGMSLGTGKLVVVDYEAVSAPINAKEIDTSALSSIINYDTTPQPYKNASGDEKFIPQYLSPEEIQLKKQNKEMKATEDNTVRGYW